MLKDLNQLIDYIEEHLTEGLSYKIRVFGLSCGKNL